MKTIYKVGFESRIEARDREQATARALEDIDGVLFTESEAEARVEYNKRALIVAATSTKALGHGLYWYDAATLESADCDEVDAFGDPWERLEDAFYASSENHGVIDYCVSE